MIDLYYAPTPNGWKITIMLEECSMPYKVIPVNLGKGDQFKPDFLKISPNNRMPVIVDNSLSDPISVFESGAILMYLAEKSGRFFGEDERERVRVLEWLFWQIGGLGPMAGQVSHFVNYAPNFPGDHSYSEKRYKNEYDRLLGVMNNVLESREYLAGNYSIADMASFPWVTAYKRYEVDLDSFSNVRRWFDDIKNRPAVRRGIDVGKEARSFGKKQTKESLDMMFNQTSSS
ncbi:MAG: glutathione S-transferase N-terminal domain-containing protein, partial [Pseudomonadota bacterium]|nr:glutathione S-transferase N-terminal domain-containing protein [Pseudomonadota bacterium]